MIEMTDVLNELSEKRPVFHSEADFQHVLAWKIHENHPDLNIRLEKRSILSGKEIYFDILAFKDSKIVAIELKYKTKNLDTIVTSESEDFSLKNHGAQDQGRYDFIKDISRLENAIGTHYARTGFAIFLTNDKSYWKTPAQDVNTVDKDFRIHEGRIIINRELSWKEGAAKGTMRGRDAPITLKGEYILNWKDYSNLEGQNGEFRYLLVRVEHGNGV